MPKAPPDGSSERRIERAFEDAPAVIAIHRGPDHRFAFANRLFRESSDGREMVGRPYAEVFPEFVEQGYLAIFDRVYTTGEPFVAAGARADTPRRPGGQPEERYWNVTFQPTRDAQGAVDGITSFAFEVTEHVMMRRAAEAAEKRYDDLIIALNVVVWCVDPESWRPEWVRGDVAHLLGIPAAEVLAPGGWWSRIHPEDAAAVMAARGALRSHGERYRAEYRHGSEESGWRWIAESGQLRLEPGATRPAVWGLMHDVTERVVHERNRDQLQTQLLHVQKLESLGVLAGGISHDFNNLLTAILGNASLAELQLEPGHPAGKSIASMVAAARRAGDLTGQLLAFSGRGHFRVQPTDVNGQLRELLVLLSASVPKKVTLRLEPDPALPMVEADVSQLHQVLMNLVINGAQSIGDPGGTVVVRTGVQVLEGRDLAAVHGFPDTAPGRFVFVEVSDTGIGMDRGTVSRIFEPFFTTKQGGRGLGLAAVQGIVRGHRGLIRVYSEPGRGTTFKVFLPAGRDVSLPEGTPEPQAPIARGTVLVVDDEPAVRHFVRSALEFGGYRVVEAADGHEGVETFRALAGEVDMVLLDLTMPRMNGEEALSEMRKIRASTPVVLSSGYNEVEATRRLLGRGAVEFVQKPYPVKDLLELVGRLVGR